MQYFSSGLCSLFLVIFFYSPSGWCPCGHCKKEADGSYSCRNFACSNFLPLDDEESSLYDEYLQNKHSQRRQNRRTPTASRCQLIQEAIQGAGTTCLQDEDPHTEETAGSRCQPIQEAIQGAGATCLQNKDPHTEETAGTTALTPPQTTPLLAAFLYELLAQHESFWDIMIRAAFNCWRFHNIIDAAAGGEPLTKEEVKARARSLMLNMPNFQPPAAPNNQIPGLLHNQHPLNHTAFLVEQLEINMRNMGFEASYHQITSIDNLTGQLELHLAGHEGALALLTYIFTDDEDVEDGDIEQHYVFQLNAQGQVFCFSDAPNLFSNITMMPGLLQLIYTTVYDFAPQDGDLLTLTLFTPPPQESTATDDPDDTLLVPEDFQMELSGGTNAAAQKRSDRKAPAGGEGGGGTEAGGFQLLLDILSPNTLL